MLVFILFSTEENLVSFLCCCTCPFRVLVPEVSLQVFLVFQVPMVMLSLPRIFDDAPVAYLTPPSWCTAEGADLVDPGGDQSGMEWLCVVIAW